MTRIDFYIVPEGGSALPAAVKLCDKAAASGKQIYVACADAAQLNALDDLLWTQRQGSFIAHERHEGRAPTEPLPAVLLGTGEPPAEWHDVLLNLSHARPDYFSRFERLCEIVDGNEASRVQSRLRYKFYRERGYELKTLEQNAEGGWTQRA